MPHYKERKFMRKEGGGDEWMSVVQAQKEIQKLSGKQIIDLAKLIVQIENHYGFPCDIEWAMEKEILYITQSRPITTLTN